ncbi:peptide chain release factor 1 [Salinispira pacifica]
MIEKLKALEARYAELETAIMDPDLPKDPKRYKETMQEHARLAELMFAYHSYQKTCENLESARAMMEEESDHELREMAREEIHRLGSEKEEQEERLKILLVPPDPMDSKDIIVEIRAGTGGDEAGLFAADLYRMYTRYGETRHWKQEIITANETELGGFKEIIFSLSGKDVYGTMKYESGGHRVQRVPETESGGRIHTSAVTVAVLPEAEDTDIQINPEELRVDVYRSSGPGGQSVNTTDSAVRITHLPTGMVVTCQDEKSQHKNRAKALRVLKARLFELEEQRKAEERATARKSQIGSGDRSERIRTYNFPQNRVTDHRINLTLYKLDSVMQGSLDELFDALKVTAREEVMRTEGVGG